MSKDTIKFEARRYGCAILASVIFAFNIKTFVRAGGLLPGGFSGLTLLLQEIFAEFMGLSIPYAIINWT
ncbi:MAG: YitT family protein, partial [Blautia sp.]|nr:YitT family protein [Blautia sp.]